MDKPINAIKIIIAQKTTINLLFLKKFNTHNTSTIYFKLLYSILYYSRIEIKNNIKYYLQRKKGTS
ncbi:hypothetical protein GCM10011580_07700 [Plantactinospora veratri]|nr:hypothetical protein GCM10011580_07700 [Plantactinospora veratri]